jgi:hypothetical protein
MEWMIRELVIGAIQVLDLNILAMFLKRAAFQSV